MTASTLYVEEFLLRKKTFLRKIMLLRKRKHYFNTLIALFSLYMVSIYFYFYQYCIDRRGIVFQNHSIEMNGVSNTTVRYLCDSRVWTMGFNHLVGKYEYMQLRKVIENPKYRNDTIALYGDVNIYDMAKKEDWKRAILTVYRKDVLETMIKHGIKPNKNDSNFLTFVIKETVNGKPTLGGSSFHVELRGVENLVCAARDYFNGTYLASCPRPEACSNLTIILDYLNFDAFLTNEINSIGWLLYKYSWCPALSTLSSFNCSGGDTCKNVNALPTGNGVWLLQNQKWSWREQGCPVPFLKRSAAYKCLKSMNSINLIGDSHIRYLSNYLMSKVGPLPTSVPKWQPHFTCNNVDFWWTNYTYNAIPNLNELNKTMRIFYSNDTGNTGGNKTDINTQKKATKSDVIIISAGIWDIAHFGPESYMKNMASTLLKSIKALLSDPFYADANIFLINNIAYPRNKHTLYRKVGFRNNHVLAATNYWLDHVTKPLGIRVLDAFSVVNIRQEEEVCGNHYICYQRGAGHPYINATVGLTVGDIVISNICNF